MILANIVPRPLGFAMDFKDELLIRDRFNKMLAKEGFSPQAIPPPGRKYKGSHVQTLWEFYLNATLAERASTKQPDDMRKATCDTPQPSKPKSDVNHQSDATATHSK